MISEICAYLNNYFNEDDATGEKLIYPGRYVIENGSITLPFLVSGQYFRIFGSKQNNGVHQYGVDTLKDETFTGVIWEMRPPDDFLALVEEIEDWVDKYGDTMKNPYQSEDVIGVYRYTKGRCGAGWPNVFRQRLKQYMRL